MKIRFMSDLHCEFDLQEVAQPNFHIPEHEDDSETVLILAGDLGLCAKPQSYEIIFSQIERFKKTIFIMGNHEAYHYNYWAAKDRMFDLCVQYGEDKLVFLEDDFIVIDDVAFIGSTMWTDMGNESHDVILCAQLYMNDYKLIKFNKDYSVYSPRTHILHPRDTIALHRKSVPFIFDAVKKFREDGKKTVVMSHMAPSYQSISEAYSGSILNGAYASNLDEEIIAGGPNLWFHGHVHSTFDYMVGDTRVLCNPRGYIGHQLNSRFDVNKFVEI